MNWTLDGLTYAARKGSVTSESGLTVIYSFIPATKDQSLKPVATDLYS